MTDKHVIFMSYSRRQFYFTESLVLHLQRASLLIWFDIQQLTPGSTWQDGIASALKYSRSLILVASKESLSSPYVASEYQHALEHNLPIYIVLFDNVDIPPKLREHGILVDFRTNFDHGLEQLIAAIKDQVIPPAPIHPTRRRLSPVVRDVMVYNAVSVLIACLILYSYQVGISAQNLSNEPDGWLIPYVGWAIYALFAFLYAFALFSRKLLYRIPMLKFSLGWNTVAMVSWLIFTATLTNVPIKESAIIVLWGGHMVLFVVAFRHFRSSSYPVHRDLLHRMIRMNVMQLDRLNMTVHLLHPELKTTIISPPPPIGKRGRRHILMYEEPIESLTIKLNNYALTTDDIETISSIGRNILLTKPQDSSNNQESSLKILTPEEVEREKKIEPLKEKWSRLSEHIPFNEAYLQIQLPEQKPASYVIHAEKEDQILVLTIKNELHLANFQPAQKTTKNVYHVLVFTDHIRRTKVDEVEAFENVIVISMVEDDHLKLYPRLLDFQIIDFRLRSISELRLSLMYISTKNMNYRAAFALNVRPVNLSNRDNFVTSLLRFIRRSNTINTS